jgi:hypothetical protein
VQDIAKDTPDSDPIKQKLDEFLAGNSPQFDSASLRATDCETRAVRLVKYFGAEKSMSGEEVVGSFRSFVKACRAVQEVIEGEAAAAAASAPAAGGGGGADAEGLPKASFSSSTKPANLKVLHKFPAKISTLRAQPAVQCPETDYSCDIFEIPDVTPRPMVFDVPGLDPHHVDLSAAQRDCPSQPVVSPPAPSLLPQHVTPCRLQRPQ